jgi:hypothetical protein
MNELTKEEKEFIKLYKNYSKFIKDPEFKLFDSKWMQDGTKEKMWINIYNKLQIENHIESLVFKPVFNEESVITEMDNFIALT